MYTCIYIYIYSVNNLLYKLNKITHQKSQKGNLIGTCH